MIKALKIKWLKRKARRLYLRIMRIYDSVDCGGSLVEFMNPTVKRDRKRLLAMVRLIKRFEAQ